VFLYPAITLVGLITNSFSLIIFSRKRFQNTIFSTYFRIYLVFETVNLILPINKMFELNLNMHLSLISNFFCKLRHFLAFSNYSIAAWLLAVISLDRYLSIAYPAKYIIRKKPLFQKLTCCFIIGYNYFMYIPYWFFYIKETETNQTNQTSIYSYKCVPPGIWIEILNFFQQFLTPFSFVFLFTSLTIRTVFISRKASSNNSSITKSKDIKFAISSIVVNIIFILFNSPYFIVVLLNDFCHLFTNNQIDLYKFLVGLSFFFLYSNLILTLFINYFVNSMFKKEIHLILFGRCNSKMSKSKSTKATLN
jgi:hypothetical protein